MRYQYTAKAATGSTSVGVVDARSLPDARQQLRQRGLFALSLSADSAKTSKPSRTITASQRSRIKKQDLLLLTSQLSIMTQSGVDLAEAFQNTAEHCKNPALKAVLESVYKDVSDGMSVSETLRKQTHVFGDGYVASITAGEASGQVPTVLSRLADMIRNEMRLSTTLRTVLAYPIVLASISSMVVAALIFFVLPQFAKVFESVGAPAPPFTRFLLDSASMIRENIMVLGILFAAAVSGLVQLWSSDTGRRYRDRLLLKGVLLRGPTQALLAGRAFRLMGTMLQSGVPLLEAIHLCRMSVRNVFFKVLFDSLETDVVNGRGIGRAVSSCTFIPPGAAQMVVTAERTGKLGSIMETVGEYYEEDGERQVKELAKFLEPAVIVIMGAIVAAVVLSVMLPLLDFSTLARGQ